MRGAKECVNRQTVRDIAQGISQREEIGDLNASDGWLSSFIEISFNSDGSYKAHCSSDDKFLQTLQSQPQNTSLIYYLEVPRRTTIPPVGLRLQVLRYCFYKNYFFPDCARK